MGVRCCAVAGLGALLLGGCGEAASPVDELGEDGTSGIAAGTDADRDEGTDGSGGPDAGDLTTSTTAESTTSVATGGRETGEGGSTGALVEETPIAEEDRYVVTSDALPLVVDAAAGVLANDEAGEAGPLQVTAFTPVSLEGGSVDVAPDGSFTYIPADGFIGEDRFNYTATDTLGASDTARVRIIVFEAG